MNGSGWADLDGIALRYDYRRGDGPTYVLLHEMGGSLESWGEVTTRLLDGGGSVLVYDQRGFGLSEKPTGTMTMDQHVGDLLALLDALGIVHPVVVAGVAVGAGIAMAFAARHPARVSHVIALAPACGVASERRAGALEMAQRIALEGMRKAASALFERAYPEVLRNDAERYRQYRAAWLSGDPRSLGAIYGMLASQDLDTDIARLPAQTLLVGGEHDALRPEQEIRRIAVLCPQASCLFAPTGHFMQVNSPVLVASLLQAFASNPEGIAAMCGDHLARGEHRYGPAGPAR